MFGRKAARRRAESPLARPGRGEFSGVNSSSAGEAPAAACVGTNHRSACPVLCAQWRRQVAGVHGIPSHGVQVRRGAAVDAEGRGAVKLDERADGAAPRWPPAGVSLSDTQVSWKEGCVAAGRAPC